MARRPESAASLASAATPSRVRVLYIGGYGRSGSTLLEKILGQFPELLPLGEMRHVWNRSFRDNSPCSCGAPFQACEFWSEVVREAFGSAASFDVDHIIRLKRSVDRIALIPWLARSIPKPAGAFGERLSRYTTTLRALYEAIQRVASPVMVVDSSKDPSHAFVLATIPTIELSVVHLVRDSRAVAFSWTRKKRRSAPTEQDQFMPTFGPIASSFRWNAYNYPFHMLRRRVNYLFLRYETLLQEPKDTILGLLGFAGIEPGPESLRFLEGNAMKLAAQHTMSGNPLRFDRGPIQLKLDDQWSRDMPRWKQGLVATLTSHLMWRYGYFGAPNPTRKHPPVESRGQ